MENLTATFNPVEPDLMPIDFQGVHMVLEGPLAWFYWFFKRNGVPIQKIETELYPWLMAAKKKWLARGKEKAATIPTATASIPEKGKQIS